MVFGCQSESPYRLLITYFVTLLLTYYAFMLLRLGPGSFPHPPSPTSFLGCHETDDQV